MNMRADTPSNRPDSLEEVRVRFMRTLSTIGIVVGIVGLIVALIFLDQTNMLGAYTTDVFQIIGLLVASAVVWGLLDVQRVNAASAVFVFILVMMTLLSSSTTVALLTGIIAIILAAALASAVIYRTVNVIILGYFVFRLVNAITAEQPEEFLSIPLYIVAIAVVSLAVRFFILTTGRSNEVVRRTVNLLQFSADVGQTIARQLNQDEVLRKTVDQIRDRFGFYHVQIFLVDPERRFANLVASTGEVGQQLVRRGHRLAIGSQSVVGQAALTGEVTLVMDVNQESTYSPNDLLPHTQGEISLPLLDGERIIGVLDVQSDVVNAFGTPEVQALQIMANQLATAVRNVRLLEATANAQNEVLRLSEDAQKSTTEVTRLNTLLSKRAWEAFLTDRQTVAAIGLDGKTVKYDAAWTPRMVSAVQEQTPVVESGEQERIIAVPIVLRGQTLGAIEVVADKSNSNQAEMLDMAQAVAARLATSLDNVRLFEEVQDVALQEQRINVVVERYQSAGSVDELLQITLEELRKTLSAEHAAIRVGSVQQQEQES